MSDEITLVLPAQEEFRQIAHLVVGGLGARLDLTYEDLDDLQTALDSLLSCRHDGGDVEVTVGAGENEVRTTVGPFDDADIDELDGDGDGLGLRRVLETVADGFDVERRDGKAWVVLTKRTAATAGAAG
jgi:anti-sigma regulatory factor (Ser/Thr protein kinase)